MFKFGFFEVFLDKCHFIMCAVWCGGLWSWHHDQKTKSLHFFEDNKISKIVEFFGKTSTMLAKILNWSQNVVFIARMVIIQIKAIVK